MMKHLTQLVANNMNACGNYETEPDGQTQRDDGEETDDMPMRRSTEVIHSVSTVKNEGKRRWYTVTEIMSMMPEFDPKEGAITAKRFIDQIEEVQKIYNWTNDETLYAAQGKLRGHAKVWVDAHEAFRTWCEFSTALINDFPCVTSMANEHLALANMKQDKYEPHDDYYYRILAAGRRSKMDDCSIIRHIVNGLAVEQNKRTINSNQFSRCTDLLIALSSLARTSQPPNRTNENKQREQQKYSPATKAKTSSAKNEIICYNCAETEHISRNCPKPQKRERCSNCNRVHRVGNTK